MDWNEPQRPAATTAKSIHRSLSSFNCYQLPLVTLAYPIWTRLFCSVIVYDWL